MAGLRCNLPCLTEFVRKSRQIRIERFRANNADIYGAGAGAGAWVYY